MLLLMENAITQQTNNLVMRFFDLFLFDTSSVLASVFISIGTATNIGLLLSSSLTCHGL